MPHNCTEFILYATNNTPTTLLGSRPAQPSQLGYFRHRVIDPSKYTIFDPLNGVDAELGQHAGPHGLTNHTITARRQTHLRHQWSHPATEGQDRLILKLFNGKRGGYYVDLAARYWHKGSNTFALDYYYGWRGICVEPDSHFYPGLVLNRTCLVSCNNPVSNRAEVRRFHYELDSARENPGNDNGQKTTVQMGRILRRLNAPRVIDYLSLDVEGHEEAILTTYPVLEKYRFMVMTIERPTPLLHSRLTAIGYLWLTHLSPSSGEMVYVHHTLPRAVSFLDEYRPKVCLSMLNFSMPV